MKVLLVTPYPPLRDGLANYGLQVAAKLRQQGNAVTVVSSQPSGGAGHEDLRSCIGLLRLTRRARDFDRSVVQFHPEVFFHHMRLSAFVRQWVGLMALFRLGGDVEVVVHETAGPDCSRAAILRGRLWALLWRQPTAILVHTEAERSGLLARYGVDADRVRLIEHGESFQRRTSLEREEARDLLGIDPSAFVFLAIGFIQPHKGFDRAARALGQLAGDHVRLDIVGEVRVPTPEHDRYARLLGRLAAEDPRVHLHQGYVNDEAFDEWIVAADALVLPYREIWSSGVVERAQLYDRPVVVTAVGGLADQVRDSDLVVVSPEGLRDAMARLAGVAVRDDVADPPRGAPAEVARARVAANARSLQEWLDPLDDATRPALALNRPDVAGEELTLATVVPGLGLRTLVARAVRRATQWQLDPIVRYVNALREEVIPRGPSASAGEQDEIGVIGAHDRGGPD
ncbi:MAG: glycosyltransferase family 4 protein [Acidimicrobiales bacterium]